MELEINTEEKIIKAAEKIFLKEGYAGARMQEIADEAQINKSMLHYYFRSKDKLMEKIFSNKFNEFVPKVLTVMQSNLTFEEGIRNFVSHYLGMISQNPYLPLFLIDTMNRNPEFTDFAKDIPGSYMILWIEKAIEKGEIRPLSPYHLLLNIMALCVFPFLAKPIFGKILKMEETDYQKLLGERKEVVLEMVMKYVKIE